MQYREKTPISHHSLPQIICVYLCPLQSCSFQHPCFCALQDKFSTGPPWHLLQESFLLSLLFLSPPSFSSSFFNSLLLYCSNLASNSQPSVRNAGFTCKNHHTWWLSRTLESAVAGLGPPALTYGWVPARLKASPSAKRLSLTPDP